MADNNRYPAEVLSGDDDDGTMPNNVAQLAEAVVGHRIVNFERDVTVPDRYYGTTQASVITLDNGKKVILADTEDCCAYTTLNEFLLHPQSVDHIITGVGTTDRYTTWHIYADLGDVLQLSLEWSAGNPFYYGYGFDIRVQEPQSQG